MASRTAVSWFMRRVRRYRATVCKFLLVGNTNGPKHIHEPSIPDLAVQRPGSATRELDCGAMDLLIGSYCLMAGHRIEVPKTTCGVRQKVPLKYCMMNGTMLQYNTI